MSQKRDLHPTDEDLSEGTPDLGHPAVSWFPGRTKFAVSHPNRKDAVRMGHRGYIRSCSIERVAAGRCDGP